MQIVIPMSGFGQRFLNAGYKVPKALIEIDGKPIISYIINMFPNETDFSFICNNDHLNNLDFQMADIIKEYCPTAKIYGIAPHTLGPNHAIKQILNYLDPKAPTIVNYCDFNCLWDYEDFKFFIRNNNADGIIPSYKGFHPHSSGKTNYAYLKLKNGEVVNIQEKKPFTENKQEELASSGTYFFSSANLLQKSIEYQINNNIKVNGEFYTSLSYKYLFDKSLKVLPYELQHFYQWGTPEDLEDYIYWNELFKKKISSNIVSKSFPINKYTFIMTMAGEGKRFINKGYKISKPLIKIENKPMFMHALKYYPKASIYALITRHSKRDIVKIKKYISETDIIPNIINLSELTEGQACSAAIAVEKLLLKNSSKQIGGIFFAACDNNVIFSRDKLLKIIRKNNADVVTFLSTEYPPAKDNPSSFGWIEKINQTQIDIKVKKAPKNLEKAGVIIGSFYFKSVEIFQKIYNELINKNIRVNNEFYIDSMVKVANNMGLKCEVVNVDAYLNWGTPNELETYQYWQSCFHKSIDHPYKFEEDPTIEFDIALDLSKKCTRLKPNKKNGLFNEQ